MVITAFNNINTSFGALLIGLLCSAFLFGFITSQTYLYFRACSRDSYVLRIAVVVLWVLNILDLCFISHAQYRYLITNYQHPQDDDVQLWSLSLHFALTAAITFVVQGYFVRRLWLFGLKNTLLTVSIIPLMVAPLVIHISTTVIIIQIGRFSERMRERGWLIGCLASVLPSEILIATMMGYYLHRGRPPITRPLLTVMEYILQTSLLPCLISVAALISYVSMEDSLIFFAIHFLVGALYTSSMLVLLNTRVPHHGRGNCTTSCITNVSETTANIVSGKSTLGTMTNQSQPSSHLHLSQVPSASIGSLELRAIHDNIPSISVYSAVAPNVESSRASVSGIDSAMLGQGTLAPLREEPTPEIPMSSGISVSSHWTDPNMSIDSVSSKSMERPRNDLGDIEWNGDALLWQLEHSSAQMG